MSFSVSIMRLGSVLWRHFYRLAFYPRTMPHALAVAVYVLLTCNDNAP